MSNKNTKSKKDKKQPAVKTIVKQDNTVEVVMKSPAKTKSGRFIIWFLVIGMSLFGLVTLIWVIIANWSTLF